MYCDLWPVTCDLWIVDRSTARDFTVDVFSLNQIKLLLFFFQIKASNDTSNFDSYPREEEVPPDEFSGWDKEF